jgi:hypothetical protein
MANAQQFYNDLVVDVLKTAFYGSDVLPIMSIDFPKTSLIDSALSDAEGNSGTERATVEWEFGIEVLLTGEKYRRYVELLDLPSSILVYFNVESELTVSYSYYPGSYQDPPEENVELDEIENFFSDEVWIEGEQVIFTKETDSFYADFCKKHGDETDEDMEYTVNQNKKKQLLSSIIISQKG